VQSSKRTERVRIYEVGRIKVTVLLINRTSATSGNARIDIWKLRPPLCKMLRTSGGKAELSDYYRGEERWKLFLTRATGNKNTMVR
jgi:hypothetical protein